MPNQSGGNFLKQMQNFFNTYLHQKAPFHLPHNAKEWIVKYGPWITLVLMILAIPAILFALGVAAIFSPFAMMYGGYHYSGLFILSGLIGLLSLVVEAMALPGLFARSMKGWQLLYYAVLINAVSSLLSGQIIGMIIGTAISLYILFEIKELYR